MLQRTIAKITQSSWHQGFLGPGHTASAILDHTPYGESDPFILFMDDRLDLPGDKPVGGPHPHAGFETLTLVLEGDEKEWKTGSFELMTAGKGIIHTEEISTQKKLHILQVWLALPPQQRWVEPFWQKITLEHVPTIKNDNFEIRVYSGKSNGLTAPLKNYTPLTLVDFKIRDHQMVIQELPPDYEGFIYMLSGRARVGNKTIEAGQTGWLNRQQPGLASEIRFTSLAADTRFILYTAVPHNTAVVSYGPFIGDTMDDIKGLYAAYRSGTMPHLNALPPQQKIEYNKAT